MSITITMPDPVGVLMEELTYRGITQDSVAITYAYIIVQLGSKAPWSEINAAISEKWPSKSGLTRVKEKAWKQVESWRAGSRLTSEAAK